MSPDSSKTFKENYTASCGVFRKLRELFAKERQAAPGGDAIRESPFNINSVHAQAWLAFALFVLVCWTFGPVIYNDFIGFDDPDYVIANGHVQQGLSLQNLAWAFSNTESANWHPLTWLSH